jgi:hypothetical protein
VRPRRRVEDLARVLRSHWLSAVGHLLPAVAAPPGARPGPAGSQLLESGILVQQAGQQHEGAARQLTGARPTGAQRHHRCPARPYHHEQANPRLRAGAPGALRISSSGRGLCRRPCGRRTAKRGNLRTPPLLLTGMQNLIAALAQARGLDDDLEEASRHQRTALPSVCLPRTCRHPAGPRGTGTMGIQWCC